MDNLDNIQRSQLGDREAFGDIVRQYQGIVSGIAYGLLGDFHRSEDVAQETFLVAWSKLDELRDVAKFPAWLCGIARNVAKKHLQRSAKLATISTEESGDEPESLDDPAGRLIREERNRLIWNALERIPENYRIPLILYYRNEESMPEIAAVLECSEEALAMRLSRARKYLRKELERQVADSIVSGSPGEFFSLGVIAALPLIAMSSTSKAAAVTMVAAQPVVASAVVCTPSGCAPGSAGSPFISLGGLALSVLSIISIISFWFCWGTGLLPSLWRAVRNAPTLRARRYLILTSLRLCFLFAVLCSFWFTFSILWMPLSIMFSGRVEYTMFAAIRDASYLTGWVVVGLIAAVVLLLSIFGYKRILREEAGLTAPKKAVPLEESPLSYKRLEGSFFRYGITILILFLLTVCAQVVHLFLIALQGQDPWMPGCGLQGWELFFHSFGILQGWELFFRSFGMQYMLVGLLCLIVFRWMHRSFLATAKDEESFAATPAIMSHDMPFRERVFLEWLISFGIFCAAGLIFLVTEALIVGWIPRSPVSLFEALLLLFALTFGAAAVNTRFPVLRWLINAAVIGVLFASFLLIVFRRSEFMGWKNLPFQDFFDSAASYPVLFGLIVLNVVIVVIVVTAMILGILYIRRKGTGRFYSQRTIKMIFCIEIAAIFATSAFLYVPAKIPCFVEILVCRYRDDWTSHHNAKMSALASEIIRSTAEEDSDYGWAHGIRAKMNLRERRYNEAITDYDVAIRLCSSESFSAFHYNNRGEAKLAKGDFTGALEDFNEAIRLGHTWNTQYYNRGFAQEKLGNIEEALADYDKAIDWAKRFLVKPPVVSAVGRTGYDDENRRRVHDQNRFGYVISFEELVEIRDRLAQ